MDYSQFIAGEFRAGTSDTRFTVFNPSNGRPMGDCAHASRTDVEEAVAVAADAFRTWRKTSAMERAALLRRAASLVRERSAVISRQIALESGKPLGDALKEAVAAAEMFEWASEEARRMYGRTIPPRREGITQTVVMEPVGPVAAFTDWSAPAMAPARKIGAALAAGCTLVVRPSEETAGVALLLASVIQDAGIPDGVVNMVFGDPAQIDAILCESPRVAMISFTGDTSAGKALGVKAAQAMKRANLELGGHAPVVVCDDVDVDRVVRMAVASKYRHAGQSSASPTRFVVHAPIFEAFCAKFVRAAEAIQIGDPFDSATQMGPLKNPSRLESIERTVQDARRRGLAVATGGERVGREGWFYRPTVIVRPTPDCEAANLEPLGPLALISPFERLDDAIAEANRRPFGLAAYAFTNHLQQAHRLMHGIDSGVVCLNEWQAWLPETPFGGYKDSGLGCEGGTEGIQAFLRVKCTRQGWAA